MDAAKQRVQELSDQAVDRYECPKCGAPKGLECRDVRDYDKPVKAHKERLNMWRS